MKKHEDRYVAVVEPNVTTYELFLSV